MLVYTLMTYHRTILIIIIIIIIIIRHFIVSEKNNKKLVEQACVHAYCILLQPRLNCQRYYSVQLLKWKIRGDIHQRVRDTALNQDCLRDVVRSRVILRTDGHTHTETHTRVITIPDTLLRRPTQARSDAGKYLLQKRAI